MKGAILLIKIKGIVISLHWTFIFLFAWILILQAINRPSLSGTTWSLLAVAAIFCCVILHELGIQLLATVSTLVNSRSGTGRHYFLPGKLQSSKLYRTVKLLLKMGARLSRNNNDKIVVQDYNEVKREHLTALVNAVRSYMGQRQASLTPYKSIM